MVIPATNTTFSTGGPASYAAWLARVCAWAAVGGNQPTITAKRMNSQRVTMGRVYGGSGAVASDYSPSARASAASVASNSVRAARSVAGAVTVAPGMAAGASGEGSAFGSLAGW